MISNVNLSNCDLFFVLLEFHSTCGRPFIFHIIFSHSLENFPQTIHSLSFRLAVSLYCSTLLTFVSFSFNLLLPQLSPIQRPHKQSAQINTVCLSILCHSPIHNNKFPFLFKLRVSFFHKTNRAMAEADPFWSNT